MAKETLSKARGKGQKPITSFFGGSKAKKEAPDASSDNSHVEDDSGSDVEMDETPVAAKKGNKSNAPDSSDLPPIHDIPAIFSDLVSHIPDIKAVAEHISGRKLRVATMCSGTESPLLALELIQKCIKDQHGVQLDVEHVFSCEIEPFKQAYIERNFHPPLLFRDVCELGDEKAHTAYGALATVPGDVDMLIAGTSCVDYSNLNTQKQDIDDNGESGRTFRGMLTWVDKHRPPLVILENVCSAPWDKVKGYFEGIGYSANWQRVDTKQYYIPHTRTRVYLVAVNKRGSKIPDEWNNWVKHKLKRPASSTLDAFLLPSDDPRIHQARQKLVQESYNALDRRTGRTDWGRCESRHQRARLEECLGSKRPLTSWDEGGFCKLPDFAWDDWGVGQVERVWDLMDISLLRAALKGIDPSYKTHVWNLSQNVDRTIGSGKVGVCPCLTPSMIPYITNRGGPMVGLEALSMQGLPVDKLLLTRETEDQLADLAGNAMSSTVVGACILAALVSGKKLLKAGDDVQTYETKARPEEVEEAAEEIAMDVDISSEISAISTIVGEDQLAHKPLDLAVATPTPLSKLLVDAARSARLCHCEGRVDMTTRELSRCIDCGTTSCKKCGGRPEHNPVVIDTSTNPRLSPSEFSKELEATLPMCITLTNVTQDVLDGLKETVNANIPDKRWSSWSAAVMRTSKSELRFVETKRQEIWSAVYRSPVATLELLLHPQQPEWRLYAAPEESEPANAEIRRILEFPIGRLSLRDGLLSGQWEFALPCTTTVPLKLLGVGDLAPSWEARLGLTGDDYKNRVVHSSLEVTVPADQVAHFDRNISGTYDLFEKCGTANGALHKKRATDDETGQAPLFMLLDPHRTDDSEDCFVFSISNRRYEYGESRPIICKLDSSWRQNSQEEEQEVVCHIPAKWTPVPNVNLQSSLHKDATFGTPTKTLEIPISSTACCNANALLLCSVPLAGQAGPEWPRETWREVDKVHERSTFKSLAWLLERVRHFDEKFDDWQEVAAPADFTNCERCAPTAPTLQWTTVGKKVVPIEDPVQAGEYERRLKRRPSPFVTQLKLDANGVGTVRIGVNLPSLIHRALSRLPSIGRVEPASLSWKLDTKFTPLATITLPPFNILSNKLDKQHSQPPSFKLDLRPEQLRSLEWMIRQESRNVEPFIEEEISEAILGALGWRAEGHAQRLVHIRGGVLADQVGYGKTAITLGLIDCTSKSTEKEFEKKGKIPGKISVKGTLVIVPPHLTKQWASEVKKFTNKRFKVVVITTLSNLNSATIEQIQEADIIIVASNLFKSGAYLDNLQQLAAAGELPTKDGRHFNAHLEKVLSSLKSQTDLLQTKGAAAVITQMKKAEEEARKAAAAAAVQSKRLKGKSYREAFEKEQVKSETKVPVKKETANSKETNGKNKASPSYQLPSGLVPEVFIDTLPPRKAIQNGNKSTTSSVASSPPESEAESDAPRKTRRRITTRKPMIVSDESGESSEEKPKKSKKASTKKRPSKKTLKSDESSDYEGSSAEESDSDVEDDLVSSGEESSGSRLKAQPKGKVKPKTNGATRPKAIPRPKKVSGKKTDASSSNDDTEGDDMDVDDETPKPKKSTKRKAADDDERPAKKQKRADNDPWKLESKAVQKEWTNMRAPPLEMFHFARKVVDEYTYLDGKVHSLVTKITADRNWVLSGTPPIHDFGALKTIAAFLNLHLGVDDDGEGQSAEIKKRRKEQTAVERFHSFREVHSLEWHANRHKLGQTFLNRFVRQNIAEIDEIPWTGHIKEIILPAAERAIYLELEHHLRALDMTIKRGKKTESDREKRLAQSLGDSKSAEEALLKRCSHFDLEMSNDNAMKACDVIVKERQKQLDECKADLLKAIKDGVEREKKLGNTGSESMFNEWIRVSRGEEGIEDKEASAIVVELLDKVGVGTPKAKVKTQDIKLTEKVKEAAWEHREKTHEIRRLTKELVGRVRSLRYFTVVRDLQKQREEPPEVSCPTCKRKTVPMAEVAVLSSCGHMGCFECVMACADKEECVYAASGACKSAARVLNVVKAETLGIDDEARDGRGKHFGMKLEKVVDLIKNKVAKDERVLVFVQFPDLMKKVTEAFTYNKIHYLEIKGTAHQKSKNLEQFQSENCKERVLLLNVMDESASGANLTCANHAIFLSPLLAPSKEIYKACETQAIGRLVRFGQTKHVHVWRFVTKNTIDEEIYEQRKDVVQVAASS